MDASRSFLGTVLTSSWINLLLYTAEIILLFFYFSPPEAVVGHRKEGRSNWSGYRWWLYGMLVIDSACTFGIFASTFFELVLRSTAEINEPAWPIAIVAVTTALSAFWEQTFLIHRYWGLSRASNWIFTYLTPFMIGQVIFAIVSVVELVMDFQVFGDHGALICAVLRATVDIILMATLVWKLAPYTSRWSPFFRFIIISLTCGSAAAIISIICIAFQSTTSLVIYTVFFGFHGRVYGLTILGNLIIPHSKSRRSRSRRPRKNSVMRHSNSPVEVNVGGVGVWVAPAGSRSQLDMLPEAHIPTVARFGTNFKNDSKKVVRDVDTVASGLSIGLGLHGREEAEADGSAPSSALGMVE